MKIRHPNKKLPRSFYLQPTLKVAEQMLGKYFVRKLKKRTLTGKIVEVEAYLGEHDPASHAYRGRTLRNDVMFWKGGHLYVYFTYGMHFCANVVTEKEGIARAVLLRALEPLQGKDLMAGKRGFKLSEGTLVRISNGPAKLCQAFGIGRKQNGTDLTGSEIFITEGENIPSEKISRTPRIGITNGRDKKWRFYIKGNRFVSGFRQ